MRKHNKTHERKLGRGVVVTGSIAFDYIMRFDGRFGDQILAEKLDVINISFLAHRLEKKHGGCGANIAYTLALLGLRPRLVASVGGDFQEYRAALERVGVDLDAV